MAAAGPEPQRFAAPRMVARHARPRIRPLHGAQKLDQPTAVFNALEPRPGWG
jgi:hypothetical protein